MQTSQKETQDGAVGTGYTVGTTDNMLGQAISPKAR